MKKIILLAVIISLLPIATFAQQQHFIFTANTGDSYSIVVNDVTLDGVALNEGDEVGVFTPDSLCVGASIWPGVTPFALIAWTDDSQTNDVDGYTAGEQMHFRIWQQSSETEFDAQATFTQGDGTFGNNAFAQLSLAAVSGGTGPSTILVTNTNDSGAGSLRDAITKANTEAGSNEILFNIPQTDAGFNNDEGIWKIQPTSELPAISDSGLVIDGFSQAGFIGSDMNPDGPEIVLNGELAGTSVNGLFVTSSQNIIVHLVVNGFTNFGILLNLEKAHHNTVIGCYVGTNASGDDSVPNNIGVYVWQAQDNVIGGTEPEMPNVISGNTANGITLGGENANHNLIIGNYIGTVSGGDAELGNGGMGITVSGSDNRVGGSLESERNIISGNGHDGIRIGGNRNLIFGNYIGTDLTGSTLLGNNWDGVAIWGGEENVIGGLAPGQANIISGNSTGVLIHTNNNVVSGNLIGTDIDEVNNLGNIYSGIFINSGAKNNQIGPENIIVFNGGSGVTVFSDTTIQNTITQNSITANGNYGIENKDGGNKSLTPPANVTISTGSVSGTALPNSTVELFSDDDNEGRIYEGTTTTDNSGNFQWTGTPAGPNVTATVTDTDGNTSQFSQPEGITTVAETAELAFPEEFSLSQNYPNPFNPVTKIQFELPSHSKVTLKIYNLLGEVLLTLVDEEMSAGIHSLIFNGDQLNSGVFFYRLRAINLQNGKSIMQTRKLMLLK